MFAIQVKINKIQKQSSVHSDGGVTGPDISHVSFSYIVPIHNRTYLITQDTLNEEDLPKDEILKKRFCSTP